VQRLLAAGAETSGQHRQGLKDRRRICAPVLSSTEVCGAHVYATSFSSLNFAKLMTADRWRRKRTVSGLWMSCSKTKARQQKRHIFTRHAISGAPNIACL
jgi:hypothetical protein